MRGIKNPSVLEVLSGNQGRIPVEDLQHIPYVSQNGEIGQFWDWLNHMVAEVSDMWYGGSALPGISTNEGGFSHTNDVVHKLEEAIEFLKRHSQYYTKHPPVIEM